MRRYLCFIDRDDSASHATLQHRARPIDFGLQQFYVFPRRTRVRDRLDDAALLRPAKLIEINGRAVAQPSDEIRAPAMPSQCTVATLERTVRDELRECGAGLARRAELFDLLAAKRAPGNRVDNFFFDSRKRGASQQIGRRREPIRSPRFDPGDRGDYASVRVRDRYHVVRREKLHQLEMRPIEQRPRLQNFEYRLQVLSRKIFSDLGDDS